MHLIAGWAEAVSDSEYTVEQIGLVALNSKNPGVSTGVLFVANAEVISSCNTCRTPLDVGSCGSGLVLPA
jgi:hypothetical protein